MQVFLETAVDAIITIDSRGLIESFNPAAERMFGYREVHVVGMNVNVLMPAPYAAEHDGYLARFLGTGLKAIIGSGRNVEALRNDGTVFPIHLSVAELELDGEIRFTGIIRDLTEEKKLRAREVGAAHLIEASLNEIFVFDTETLRFLQVNRGGRSNLGRSMEELSLMTAVDVKPELDEEAFRELARPLLTGEEEIVVFRTEHIRKDQSRYPVEVHLQLGEFDGRPAFAAIILDTTKRDQLQAQLLHSQKLDAIGQLAGALAHDFNNLLMGVMSGCRMVSRRVEGDEMSRSMLEEIQKEARKGAGITRQLLDFSRKSTYETGPCDLSAIVRDSDALFRNLLGEDIELDVQADTSNSVILADAGKMDQVLMNLVVNARDAVSSGGRIGIDVSSVEVESGRVGLEPGPYSVLSVSDNGCGMDKETQARVFEPFFTTKRMGKGTGLGLSTVFGLTQEFGGQVELTSALGEGTTFRLYFPLADKQESPGKAEPVAEKARRGTETILVVEDASLVRAGLRHLLQNLGYTVLDAPDPKEALEILAHAGQVDLLLTDIVMPGMSGPELAEQVRTKYPAMRVLFMSGYSDASLIAQGRLQSGMPVLEKPFEEEELARLVREQLSEP